jgi:hypothetical protein
VTTAPRQQPWSRKTDVLVRHVAPQARPSFLLELGHWIDGRPRFATFVAANQDKIRKKLITSDGEEGRQDVRAELLIAYLILADKRFELAFETYGARQRGPDLTVTYRANQRFNLEVTRLRASSEQAAEPAHRLANVIAGKVRQLPPDLPNALVILSRALALTEEHLGQALRLLKSHAESKDVAFFARRGIKDAREFHGQFTRLSGVFSIDDATTPASASFFANRDTRHPLPSEALARLTASLTA